MAIFHASTKPIRRSSGRSSVAAAAYRSGSELTDQRTGLTHDFTRKGGIESVQAFMPDGSTVDRESLWNAAESAENRKDARTAREWEVALPAELSKEGRTELAQGFARELSARYGVAADCAIHAPGKRGDQRNWHAHIMLTTRQVGRENGQIVMGPKSDLELDNKQRAARGLQTSQDQIKCIREEWADRANHSLEHAQAAERVDHRSHAERGIEAEPGKHLGPYAAALQRSGQLDQVREAPQLYLGNENEKNLPQAERHELASIRQQLAELRESLKEFAAVFNNAAKSAVGAIMDHFRMSRDANTRGHAEELQASGFLARFREQRSLDQGYEQAQANTQTQIHSQGHER